MGRLRILNAGVEPAVLELPGGTTTLGRREDNPLCLPDASVSSRHCELTETEGRLTIRDLGSTNGTFIDGERAEHGTVAPGGTFKLGGIELCYEVDAPVASAAAAEQAPAPPTPAPAPVIAAPKLPTLVAPPAAPPAPGAPAVAGALPKLSPAEALKQSLAKASAAPAPRPSPASPPAPPPSPGSADAPAAGVPLKPTLGAPAPVTPAPVKPVPAPAAPKPGGPKLVPTGEPSKLSLGGHKPAPPPAAAPAAAAPVAPTDGPSKLSLGGSHKSAPAAAASTTPPTPAKAPPPAVAKGEKPCDRHPANAAQYICPKCRCRCCDECVKVHDSGRKRTAFCPVCANKVMPTAEFAQQQASRLAREDLPFHQQIKGVFKYPFGQGGLAMLIIGTLLFLVLDFLVTWGWRVRLVMLKVTPYVGILATFSAGYLCAYLQKILHTTANGDDDVPGWPEFSQWWDDIVVPFRLFIAAFAASFGPAFAYMIFHARNDTEMSLTVLFPLFALGFLYFPMALLAAAMSNSWSAVNPLVVLPAITRLNLQYVLACVVFFALVLVRFLSEALLNAVLPIPVLPTLITSFMALYFLAVEVRLLGLLYYTNRKRLGWFSY